MAQLRCLVRRWGLAVLAIVLTGLLVTGCDFIAAILNPPSDTLPFPVLLTPAIPERPATEGETFLAKQFKVQYRGGRVLVSSTALGDGSIFVDDVLDIKVIRPDGSEKYRLVDFSGDCLASGPEDPQEITDLFLTGKNTFVITLFDACGGSVGSSALWLVNIPAG